MYEQLDMDENILYVTECEKTALEIETIAMELLIKGNRCANSNKDNLGGQRAGKEQEEYVVYLTKFKDGTMQCPVRGCLLKSTTISQQPPSRRTRCISRAKANNQR